MLPLRRTALTLVAAVASVGLILPSLSAPASARPSAPAAADHDMTWCTSSPAPCIQSVTRNGTAITAADSQWDISGVWFTSSEGATQLLWDIGKSGAFVHDPSTGENYVTMGAGEEGNTWSLNFDLGSDILPRVTNTYGDDVTTHRVDHGDGTYNITVTGNVIKQSANAECDTSVFPAVCPVQAGADVTEFAGEVDDFGQWTDAAQRADFYGLDSWTNVEVTYIPPTISGDPLQIVVPLQNSYKYSNGDVFNGFYHVVIPNHFLQDMGIDDPSTISPAGVDATVGAGSVNVNPGPDAVQVDATNITFPAAPVPPGSARAHAVAKKHTVLQKVKLKRGTITPTRPSHVTAKRAGANAAKVAFHRAKPRGSKIKGYQARCVAHHAAPRKATAKHSAIKVKHLSRGVAYKCQVRAKAKAGYGHWSHKDKA
jgi:hypothetical protein